MNPVDTLHQTLAWNLKQKHPEGFEFAWILNERQKGPFRTGQVFWSAYPTGFKKAPSSALIKLVQGLFEEYRDHSFFLLRQRLYTTASISPMDRALIEITAKRVRGGILPLKDLDLTADIRFQEIGATGDLILKSKLAKAVPEEPMIEDDGIFHFLEKLTEQVERGPVLHDYDRPIAAVLVDRNQKILQSSLHGGSINKTLHAEVRLCQDYFLEHGSDFPEGSRLYVSLKPCRMCAAMIAHLSDHLRDFQVIYVQDDPGPAARQTCLEKSGRQISKAKLQNKPSNC